MARTDYPTAATTPAPTPASAPDFDIEKHVSPNMEDVRTWWSFKENVEIEDPNLAIGFFDLFAGVEPNWTLPAFFSARKSPRRKDAFFEKFARREISED